MRLRHFLVTVISVFGSINILLAAAEVGQATSSSLVSRDFLPGVADHGVATPKRSLRLIQGDENASDGATGTDERVSLKIPMKLKIAWWLALDKSEDSVKKALGMEGLTGPALKAHSNYKLLAKYADKAEKYHLRKMVQGGFPTYEIWAELGFSRITDTRQIEKIKHTSAYTTYKRYVNMFDDNIFWMMGSGYYLPKFVSENATPAEMTARAQIWAEAGRSDDYVRMILGLKGLDGARLIRNKNYSYYAEFLAKTQSLSH